jgi:hypothetical protein
MLVISSDELSRQLSRPRGLPRQRRHTWNMRWGTTRGPTSGRRSDFNRECHGRTTVIPIGDSSTLANMVMAAGSETRVLMVRRAGANGCSRNLAQPPREGCCCQEAEAHRQCSICWCAARLRAFAGRRSGG